MTNAIAVWIVGLIGLALVLDLAMGWEAHLFLARKFVDLLDWVAFWR